MARKPTPAPESKEVAVNEVLIREDFATLDKLPVELKAQMASRSQEVFELGRQVGAVHMARLQANFSAAAEVSLFAEIQKSNAFKHLPIRMPDGSSATAENCFEFCQLVFGENYHTLRERKETLDALGASAYDAATRLGLNRRQLRLVRALPDAKREAVQEVLAAGDKAEVVSLIEDLAADLAKTQTELADVKAEREADQAMLDKKQARIDKLERDVRRVNKLPPDEQLLLLKREATELATEAEGLVLGGLRQALIALANHGEERGDQQPFMAGLVAQVQRQLTALRDEFNLPESSATPEWEAWAAANPGSKG